MKELNATFCEKKDSTAFEGMIITSDTAFFVRLGWKKGEETPYAVMEFFNRCYEFALQEIGYKGTDKNILSAVIHVDEKTPHLQLYYIPVVDTAKKKVYEKGTDRMKCTSISLSNFWGAFHFTPRLILVRLRLT